MTATADFKSPRILEVKAGDGDYVVIISWDDGTTSRVDLTELIFRLKYLRPLRNKDRFKQVQVEVWGWSISWGDDLDLSGEKLWELSREQQSSVMTPSDFRTWLKRHGLTQEAAADMLGVSKRMISYYATGAQPITRTIALAMKGADVELNYGEMKAVPVLTMETAMAKPRDTYKYQFKVGNKIVHGGITDDLERREAEHQQKWPKGHIKQVGRRTTEKVAREWEKDKGYT